MTAPEREAVDIQTLLEAVFEATGFDFRQYTFAAMQRRVWRQVHAEGVPDIEALRRRLVHDRAALERFVVAATVHSTAMFRDPAFYRALREQVVPLLRTYPFVRIWHAGCSTGEEVYSLAIVLDEENLLGRCRIYATDVSDAVLDRARARSVPLALVSDYAASYREAGGRRDLAHYYALRDGQAIFGRSLADNILFSQHNLAIDRAFNSFNLVLCRNVLIYFNADLQTRVHRLLHDSLARFGVLALGRHESLRSTALADRYQEIDAPARLYRRIR